jgi:hypothetical protein
LFGSRFSGKATKQFSVTDAILSDRNENLCGIVEAKCRTTPFKHYSDEIIDVAKVDRILAIAKKHNIEGWLLTRWGDGTLGFFNLTAYVRKWENDNSLDDIIPSSPLPQFDGGFKLVYHVPYSTYILLETALIFEDK